MKDESSGKILKEFVGLRAKQSSYLKDSNDEDKKSKSIKCVIRKKINFQDYKNCLEAASIKNRIKTKLIWIVLKSS